MTADPVAFEGAPMFGRDAEIVAILNALDDPDIRFLTLIGPGGVGKTVIAQAVRGILQTRETDVQVVELASERTAAAARDALTVAVARMESPLPATAGQYLVIENIERLGPLARSIGSLLAAHPQLTVLGTSRVATGISSEYRRAVLAFPLGNPDDTAGDGITAARQVFNWHTRRISPTTQTAGVDDDIVDAISRRLDGLPLALQIAAHQLSVMNHAALLSRLERGGSPFMRGASDLPDRHLTLAATFDDSIAALNPDERDLLALSAVFEGLIDPAAITAMLTAVHPAASDRPAMDEHMVLQHLTSLAQHHLLAPVTAPPHESSITFRMLNVTRDCARQVLLGQPNGQRFRLAHATYFCRRALDGTDLAGTSVDAWLKRTDRDLDDVRSALRFLLDQGDQQALDLAAGMRNYWLARGLLREGIEWLTEGLTTSTTSDSVPWLRAFEAKTVLLGAANSYASVLSDLEKTADLWHDRGEPLARARTLVDLAAAIYEVQGFQAARPLFEEAIEVLDSAGDRWWAARARSLLGASAAADGEYREFSLMTLDRAVEDFRSLGDVLQTNLPLQQLGRILHEEGHDVHAAALLNEGLTLAQDAGDAWNSSVFLNLLAEIELSRGNALPAARLYLDSLALAVDIDAKPRFIWCLEGLAAALAEAGEHKYPARLIGLAVAIRSNLKLQNWVEFPAKAIDVTSVQSSLPRATFEALRADGYRMSVGDVLEYVPQLLAEKEAAAARTGQRHRYPDGLTNREVEVLRLIAAGNTSRAIASTLFVSIETVGRHISNLYRKIGASGRAEATAYAIRSGLQDD